MLHVQCIQSVSCCLPHKNNNVHAAAAINLTLNPTFLLDLYAAGSEVRWHPGQTASSVSSSRDQPTHAALPPA